MAEEGGNFFDEREIRAILKRAADLQSSEGGSTQTGLSLEELRLLASEAGIDPNFVERAAFELTSGIPEESEKTDFFGGPFSFTFEREITGSGSPELWESIVTTIRKIYKDSGTVRTWGNSMEWTRSGLTQPQASVTLSDRNGKLKLQVFYKDTTIPVPFFINFFLLMVVSTALLMSAIANPFLGIGILISVFIPLYFLVRFASRALAQKKKKRAKKLTDALVRLCIDANSSTEVTRSKTTTPASETGKGLLDTIEPEISDEQTSDENAESTGRRRVR
jgi:hypothetical protein